MNKYSLAHLSDSALLAGTRSLIERDRATTAELIAHLAEVDDRRLYAPAGYPSMYDWCTGHLGLSEDSAYKRIRAARATRLYPVIFPMISDGRLTLRALVLLAPVLTTGNASELLALAAGRSKNELERLIAERFPRADAFAMVSAIGSVGPRDVVSEIATAPGEHSKESVYKFSLAPGPVAPSSAREERARMVPLSPGRYSLSVTITQETFDALEYAKSLLGHSVPDGDLEQVLDRALKVLVAHLEKQRFAKCSRSGPSRRRGTSDPRAIPAAVRRLVWERDGGRCTFVGENGTHCQCRTRLEFDHIEPLARGGQSTPSNLRLRCRAHNQLAAERAFGREFMRGQREAAKRRAQQEREAKRAAEAKERESARAAEAKEHEAAQAAEQVARANAHEREASAQAVREDVVKALRNLGYSASTSREAARVVDQMPGATFEQHLRAALKSLLPRSVRIEHYGITGSAGTSSVEGNGIGLGA